MTPDLFNPERYRPTKTDKEINRHRDWDRVLDDVIAFMGEDYTDKNVKGHWRSKCKGISHHLMSAWMDLAESTQNLPDFPKQKLFNMEKQKYNKNHEE